MKTATKVAFNTVILYIKILLSMAIALVSVPLVLRALGTSDYGLYNLVAGIVAMLSFLNNTMTVSSQRYMSVAMGANDKERVNIIYNTSFLLNLLLGVVVIVVLECGAPFINKLNIADERIDVAQILFQFLVISTFSKIISVPFDAIINAREDMLVFTIIELIDSLLMLGLAIGLQYILFVDKLIFYGIGVLFIAIFTFLMKYLWAKCAYKEYRIELQKYWGKLQIKDMLGFAGWNLFGGLAIIGRNQGVAIIINVFIGTVANAAYGVANHINGALGHFASTFQKALNPQLMKSEGMNDRKRLQKISFISSKFSVLSLCFFALPLIVEMKDVLSIWLKDNIPPYTMELSCCILLLSIVYQFSVGIMSAIQAVGRIRDYQITIGAILLLNVPFAYFIIKVGYPIYYATAVFVIFEIFSLLIRLLFGKRLVGISLFQYWRNVMLPVFLVTIPALVACLIPHYFITGLWQRLILTCFVYAIFYLPLFWYFALDTTMRGNVLTIIHKKR